MDLKPTSRQTPPQAPLVEPTPPAPAEDPFKPDHLPSSEEKTKQKHHRGKSLKKFMLFVLVLALLGGTGYGTYYWQHQQVDKFAKQVQGLMHHNSEMDAEMTKLMDENAKLTADAAADAATTSSTFKIPELGIQLTVPDSLKDLTYTIRNGEYDDGSTFIAADLSTKALTTADKNCASSATPALGGLFRSEGTGPKTATTTTAPPVALKQFSGFYISQSYGQAACSTTKTVVDAVAKAKDAYKATLTSIQLVK